jgi:membrane associated rhomboid family serine protease
MILTPWVLRLLLANILVYLATMAAPQIAEHLMFVPVLVLLQPWTIITYQFVHAGMFHLFFNMLSLIFFGPRLEMELGSRDFLLLYFISGIAGGLLSVVTPHTAIVGASGSIYGIMMAYAVLWPRSQIFLWGIVPVEARWLVLFMTAMSLYGGFRGTDEIAHFAHLGGFLGGYLFLRWRGRAARRAQNADPLVAAAPSRSDLHRWSKIDRHRLHEVNREEFDRIQQKIHGSGAGSLTPTEIAFLDRFAPDDES